jgi:hypothetical protein
MPVEARRKVREQNFPSRVSLLNAQFLGTRGSYDKGLKRYGSTKNLLQ